MPLYFTADLHLGHPRLAANRGFRTVAGHDAAVMSALYELDPDTDTLWVLGDISSSSRSGFESALEQLSTVRVPMHLVLGNHDAAHSMREDSGRYRELCELVFDTLQESVNIEIGGRSVSLSHFPYLNTRDRYSRRNFQKWQLTDNGGLLLHGHTHSPQRCNGDRSVCVSLEAWDLRPARDDEVLAEFGI